MTLAAQLAPRPLYEAVAERLRQRIYSRELLPGDWIDELKIAEQLGISRTPLREALKVLATEGLVTMKVRRGAYVAESSAKDLADVYHLLALLETDAARVVAQRASDAELAELATLHAELRSAVGDAARFFPLNEAFHLRLLELSDNRWRLQIVQDLRKVMKLHRQHSLQKDGRLEASLAEHEELMQALSSRDAERAAACMARHFVSGLEAAS
ncbi:GntR family transcriptional regulator [Ottowia sp. GY511]|uniref:GntR family transcriptional regulator n=1 Tax=Ottowia flava TaxID=2675430 RepID=A0ABW4KXT4_9BURK|nr:GntR family transcriptional regulator [Ottowia sp. GY511]TXK26640.1 GntR family transcriptional regulator [Ottowia sp. GY511]